VVERVRGGTLRLAVSNAISSEYHEVAARKKFEKHRLCLAECLEAILTVAERFEPIEPCEACGDPDDNAMLACALAAGAQCVVTGNGRHFPSEWRGVDVVNARTLLERLGPVIP